MYTLRIEDKFDAAHYLPGYKGKCKNMHGHTWRVEAFYVFEELDKIGMAYDFGKLKKVLKKVTAMFDHKVVNKVVKQPTAEKIAEYIYDKLNTGKPSNTISAVRVWESATAYCQYALDRYLPFHTG